MSDESLYALLDDVLTNYKEDVSKISQALHRQIDLGIYCLLDDHIATRASFYQRMLSTPVGLDSSLTCRYASKIYENLQPTECPNKSGDGNRQRCNSHHIFEEEMQNDYRTLEMFLKHGRHADKVVSVACRLVEKLIRLIGFQVDETVVNNAIYAINAESQKVQTEKKFSDSLHCLYRMFSSSGQLLYVGITLNPGARIKAHMRDKDWWNEVANVTMEKFDSREALQIAEIAAIKHESPKYNIMYNNQSYAS